jgi:Domain of unknown function (DUF4430)
MLHRSLAFVVASLATVALALAGCGGGGSGSETTQAAASTSAGSDQAAILVTANCGKKVLVAKKPVSPGGTAMQALQAVAKLKTSYGGKFVDAINGVGPAGKNDAWLFYVNGKMAQKGAAEVRLSAGDVEWWDLHDYKKRCSVPAAAE